MYISYKIVKCVVTASIISGRIGNFWLFAAVFFLLVECKQIDDYLVIETIKPDNLSSCDNKQEMNAKKETKKKHCIVYSILIPCTWHALYRQGLFAYNSYMAARQLTKKWSSEWKPSNQSITCTTGLKIYIQIPLSDWGSPSPALNCKLRFFYILYLSSIYFISTVGKCS